MTRFLLDQGASINARDRWGTTPLILAIIHGKLETIKFLLASGADLEARDKDGTTGIFFALSSSRNGKAIPFDDQMAIFKLLCKRGADVFVMNDNGVSVLEMIMDRVESYRRREALCKILKQERGIKIIRCHQVSNH